SSRICCRTVLLSFRTWRCIGFWRAREMAMTELTPGKLLRVHLSEDDRYEAIVDRCRELGIAGATVFRALEGYGGSSEILRAHLLAKDQPVVVTIVET